MTGGTASRTRWLAAGLLSLALLPLSACGRGTGVVDLPTAGRTPTPSAMPTSSPSPPSTVATPGVLFLDQSIATSLLKDAGLNVASTVKESSQYVAGTVLAQSPKPNTMVKPGTTITLTVAKAPACDPSYPDFCIPPYPPRLYCHDLSGRRNFTVLPPDRHRFDPDKDGIGCEH
jgi:hypothetical protein